VLFVKRNHIAFEYSNVPRFAQTFVHLDAYSKAVGQYVMKEVDLNMTNNRNVYGGGHHHGGHHHGGHHHGGHHHGGYHHGGGYGGGGFGAAPLAVGLLGGLAAGALTQGAGYGYGYGYPAATPYPAYNPYGGYPYY
jgi:hypothetical protein